jgi:hypothetical protein
MSAIEKPVPAPTLPLRAQFQGTIRLLCPQCGLMGQYRLSYRGYTIRCVNNRCRSTWAVGLLLHAMDPHAGRGPGRPAQIPVDMQFPACELELVPWRSGDPVNRLAEVRK